ncbi:hypothetical protein CEE45_08620 [Candidatus Heimdallarchaeota archaeon B3_Heim]|nr:MAG: hypothetical protein CEE45_08620 [Candidatus Heimdallarchaeota archaeon B3_Heim]
MAFIVAVKVSILLIYVILVVILNLRIVIHSIEMGVERSMSIDENLVENWEIPQRFGFLIKMIKAPPFKVSRLKLVEGSMVWANEWLNNQEIRYNSSSESVWVYSFEGHGTIRKIYPKIVKTTSNIVGIIWDYLLSPNNFKYKGVNGIVRQTLGRALFLTLYDLNRLFSTHNLDWRDYYDLEVFGIEPISVITFYMEIDSYPQYIVKLNTSKKKLKNLKIYDFVVKGFHEIFQQGLDEIGVSYLTKAHREEKWDERTRYWARIAPYSYFPWFLRNKMHDWMRDDFSRIIIWNSPKNISKSRYKIYKDRSPQFFSQLTEFYEAKFEQYFSQNKLNWQKFISIEALPRKKEKIVVNLRERAPDGINQWILYEPIPDEKLYGKKTKLPFYFKSTIVKYSLPKFSGLSTNNVLDYIINKERDFEMDFYTLVESSFLKKQITDLGIFFKILIDFMYYTTELTSLEQKEGNVQSVQSTRKMGALVAILESAMQSYSDIKIYDFWKNTFKLMCKYAETVYFENEMVWVLSKDTFLVHRCCWNITNYLKENKVKLTRKTNFQSLNKKLLAICMNKSPEHKLITSEIYRNQKDNLEWYKGLL